MSDVTKENTIVVADGEVEYSLTDAAIPIGQMIEALENARVDGAEYVVALSGNHRGAKYMAVNTAAEWLEDVL